MVEVEVASGWTADSINHEGAGQAGRAGRCGWLEWGCTALHTACLRGVYPHRPLPITARRRTMGRSIIDRQDSFRRPPSAHP